MSCIFCAIVAKTEPAHILYEDDQVVAFLDKHPRTVGHLQLIPKKHVRWVYEIEDIGSFFSTAGRLIRAIIPVLSADHVTIHTFGREIIHAHLWIVPQYQTDVHVEEFGGGKIEKSGQRELAEMLRREIEKKLKK